MKKKTMIALTTGGVCIIVALAIVLGVLLKSGKSPLPVANQNFLEGTTAVSYTHLDVYKRQRLRWSGPRPGLPRERQRADLRHRGLFQHRRTRCV